MKLKFDKDMFEKHVEVFKDNNGRNPYIICSSETKECFPKNIYSGINTICLPTGDYYVSTKLSGEPKEPPKKTYDTWCGCKVFIDDDLPCGEVILA